MDVAGKADDLNPGRQLIQFEWIQFDLRLLRATAHPPLNYWKGLRHEHQVKAGLTEQGAVRAQGVSLEIAQLKYFDPYLNPTLHHR